MDIHHLKIFLAVFKNRSFSRASEELLITQPTVSEHIKSLEKYLNKKLFDRIGRKIYPTETGKLLYYEALKIVEDFENLKNKLTDKGEKNLEIEIVSSSVPGNYILPKIIIDFKNIFNNAIVSIKIADSSQVQNKILNDDSFIGFVGTNIHNPKLEHHPFMKDEIVLIAEKNSAFQEIISIKDVIKYPLIMREYGSGTRKEVESFLEKLGINPNSLNIYLVLESNEALKQAVLSGTGLTFISKFCIEPEARESKFKIIRIKEGEIRRNFYWIKKRGRTLPHIYKVFVEFIQKFTDI